MKSCVKYEVFIAFYFLIIERCRVNLQLLVAALVKHDLTLYWLILKCAWHSITVFDVLIFYD